MKERKMKISQLLKIEPGLTALIGGGGKTALMYKLADELSELGCVIVCTSTKIYESDDIAVVTGDSEDIINTLKTHRVICAGTRVGGGKLSSPTITFHELKDIADYVIVEADGAHKLPIKAHADYEPVIPDCADKTVLVMGADAFGQPISRICHRAELFAERARVTVHDEVTPELVARVIAGEGLGDIIYINKVESNESLTLSERSAQLIDLPVIAGSLRTEEYICLR